MSQLLESMDFPITLTCVECQAQSLVTPEDLTGHEIEKDIFRRVVRNTFRANCKQCGMNVMGHHEVNMPPKVNTVGLMRGHCADAYKNGAGALEAIGYAKARIRLGRWRTA